MATKSVRTHTHEYRGKHTSIYCLPETRNYMEGEYKDRVIKLIIHTHFALTRHKKKDKPIDIIYYMISMNIKGSLWRDLLS